MLYIRILLYAQASVAWWNRIRLLGSTSAAWPMHEPAVIARSGRWRNIISCEKLRGEGHLTQSKLTGMLSQQPKDLADQPDD